MPSGLKPGGQGSIGVGVRAPKGLSLAGRRVRIAVSPGHTDEASLPLTGGTTVRTVYTAPADYNGMVRVTVNIDGRRQASRTFAVGTAEAEAPPEKAPPPPSKEVTLPETPDAPAPGTFADGTYQVTLQAGKWRPSGVIQVRGGVASGKLTAGVMPPGPHAGIAGQTTVDVTGSVKGGQLNATYKSTAKAVQDSGGKRIELNDTGSGPDRDHAEAGRRALVAAARQALLDALRDRPGLRTMPKEAGGSPWTTCSGVPTSTRWTWARSAARG